MGISLSNKPDHMAKSIGRITCKWKIWCFPGCLFYYCDTTFSAKTVYLRESGKIGSLNELKTSVKRSIFFIIKGGKMDLPRKDLENNENYRMIYRKVIREAKTRENGRYIKG